MERKFRITVDGKPYAVTVEDISEGASLLYPGPGSMQVPSPVPAPAAPAAAAASPAPAAHDAAGPGDVVSNLAGVVESISVSVGQSVAQGDRLGTIEAMKMKTPIVAHCAGKVASIAVKPGDAVEPGQTLIVVS